MQCRGTGDDAGQEGGLLDKGASVTVLRLRRDRFSLDPFNGPTLFVRVRKREEKEGARNASPEGLTT